MARPRAVGELAADLPVSRPAVSQHLRVLKDAGLVSDRAEGTRRVYTVNPAGLGGVARRSRPVLDPCARRVQDRRGATKQSQRQKQRRRRSHESFTSTVPTAPDPANAPIRKTIVVAASAERAFQVFTEEMSTWWPLASKHIGKSDAKSVVIEPFVGGRWFERGVDGSECDWGRSGRGIRRGDWCSLGRSPATGDMIRRSRRRSRCASTRKATSTRVDLEHRLLHYYGEKAAQMRGIFDSDQGWTGSSTRSPLARRRS